MPRTERVHLQKTASCGCGQCRIAVNGPVYSMFLCACTECQRTTGAGHSAIFIMDTSDVSVSGPLKSFARPADSGATLTRHFCPECGLDLYATTSRRLDAVLLSPGLFEKSDWFAPNQAIFTRSHLDWDTLPGDIPHYQTYREAGTT